MRFVVEVITIGGGLTYFLGVSYSGRVLSAPAVSVSMTVVLRGAKKLRFDTAFGGSLTAADVGTHSVEFLADCDVSLELCLLHFFTSREPSSWEVIPIRFCSLYHRAFPMHSQPSVQSVLMCTFYKSR
jgi:hypothetical protein